MKRTIYTFISLLLIAIVITGCKKEEITVESVRIDKESLSMLLGEQYQLKANAFPQEATNRDIVWYSSNNSVASVTSEGIVTAESVGSATVIAQSGNATAKCEVTVVKEGDYITKVRLTKTGNINVNKIIVLMPAPQTNEYQTITNLHSNCGEYMESCNGNKVLYCLFKKYNEGMEVYQTFDYEPKHINIDFSKKPDKKNTYGSVSPENFLDSDGSYIDLNNSTIKAIGDSIWAISDGNIDYARKCYEHEAKILKYIKGGARSLAQILKEGGGECGDFTTFYVNLLRYKGIPSRHNMGVVPTGGYHVWADFYDENYGWIPVDVTFKNGDPSGDYFGKYNTDLIIMAQGLVKVQRDGIDHFGFLQNFWWWYWYSSGSGSLEAEYSLNGHVQ